MINPAPLKGFGISMDELSKTIRKINRAKYYGLQMDALSEFISHIQRKRLKQEAAALRYLNLEDAKLFDRHDAGDLTDKQLQVALQGNKIRAFADVVGVQE